MVVVSDAGPLIALAKADRLDLLQELFDEICIPLIGSDSPSLDQTPADWKMRCKTLCK